MYMTADEAKEFKGRKATQYSIDLQFNYLSRKWIRERDLSALLLLQVLISSILKEEECDQLYEKVKEMWEAMGN